MLRLAKSLVVIFIFALTGLWSNASAHPVTRYQWFTNYEVTRFNEIIWWTVQDTFRGPYRTNDYAGFRGTNLYRQFITSAPNIVGAPIFHVEPIFNAPRFNLGTGFNHLQEHATTVFPDSLDELILPRVVINDRDGLLIYTTIRGIEREEDSVWATIDAPLDQIIYFPGDVEVEGVLSGRLTIYSRGSIYLTDNVVYSNANRHTGYFEEDGNPDMLALVADKDVIVKNTWANGRNNSAEGTSICINGSIIALGESFTFEQQNDEWDLFQGPEPDERGYIYHMGSIAQFRKGSTHRSNHSGTGYGKWFNYDIRLLTEGPPGFAPGEYPYWEGQIPSQHLGWLNEYTFENATLDSLTIDPGVTVLLKDGEALTISDHFEVNGTVENPVVIRTARQNGRATILVSAGAGAGETLIRHARFEGNIELNLGASATSIDSCQFGRITLFNSAFYGVNINESTFSNNVDIQVGSISSYNCQFNAPVTVNCWNQLSFSRDLFLSGLSISGNPRNSIIDHCTITNPDGAGLFLDLFRAVDITNSIISNCVNGIVNDHWEAPVIEYSDIYGNSKGDLIDCVLGEGCLSLDPLFVDAENGDYHVAFGSPCINAGDPDSPSDPDGTRADMGAYPFDQPQDVASDTEIPSAFALFAPYPNPFNSTTTIGYSLPAEGNVSVAVYDLSGREVARLVDGEQLAGNHEIVWTADGIASGVYVVKLDAGGVVAREKVVLVK